MRRRRLGALWAVLAVLAVSLGALVALEERGSPPRAPLLALPAAGVAPVAPAPAATSRSAARRRPKLPSGRSVRAAVRRAVLTGAVKRGAAAGWLRTERRARRALRRLAGARRAELAAVLATVDGLAGARQLTPSRMPLAFLTLRRNVEVWTRGALPRPGERMTFGDDPAVFQHYAGRGVQHHALASAGRINALVQPCLRDVEARERRRAALARSAVLRRRVGAPRGRHAVRPFTTRCHASRLRRSLDSLARLSSQRAGFVAFEYLFRFGAGTPPWISGMAQATAAQALARGSRVFGSDRYRRLAVGALGAFETPAPLGVRVGGEYVMYSFAPSLHIINGFLQSLIGLHDVAELTGSRRAERLFRRGERVARAALGAYDTGAWSLYSHSGRESSLGYHELVTGFLSGMCTRTRRPSYCAAGRRFTRYLHRPPSLTLSAPGRGRAGRLVRTRFSVDKGSAIRVSILRGDRRIGVRRFAAARGRSDVPFVPRRAGRYVVLVQATGPEGRTSARRVAVRVRPRPKPRKRRDRPRVHRRSELETEVGAPQAGLGG